MKSFIIWIIVLVMFVLGVFLGHGAVHEQDNSNPPEYMAGLVVGRTLLKGYDVPLITDGKGGTVPVATNVPWDAFTIQEKMRFAIEANNHLNDKDIEEIRNTYGVK